MSETCPICGRLSVKTCSGLPGTTIDKVCFRVKAGADTTCYQVGYEREKARAEKAEAELAKHETCIAENGKAFDASLGECLDRAEKAEEALAAARRDVALLQAALAAAIAAPAAGEEGKR